MKAMMGRTWNDAFGTLLGTGFINFSAHCGCDGLAREDGQDLHVLAVISRCPRRGSFRKFVRLAKLNYSRIFVWEVGSDILRDALTRYGFTPCKGENNGEPLMGYVWDTANKTQIRTTT